MGKVKDEQLFRLIRNFFTVYLPTQRMASVNTITAYRLAWNQYLDFVTSRKKVKLKDITLETLNADTLESYLNYLTDEKKVSASTWNLKLCAIRAFFDYASACNPAYMDLYGELSRFKYQKKDVYAKVDYMTEETVTALLEAPDIRTAVGIRDQFLMILLYDTGARIQELLNIRLKDFKLDKVSTVTLHGKGNKTRIVPIMNETEKHLKHYLEEFHKGTPVCSDEYLFYIERKGQRTPMSDDAVRIRMQKYADVVRSACPTVPPKVHPHMWRHSRAMHLYQHGMDLSLISQWLGHSQMETTLVYAHADTEMKRQAIEKAIGSSGISDSEGASAVYSVSDEDLIKRLYGL